MTSNWTRKLWSTCRIILILCTFLIIYVAKPGSSLFSWHPTLLSLSFIAVIEAIACVIPDASLLPNAWKRNKIVFHWSLQVAAAVLAFAGFIAIYVNKIQNGKVHFTSWHSWVAICALMMFTLEIFGGIFLYYGKTLELHKKLGGSALLRKLHSVFGLIVITAFAATIVLGLSSNWAVAFLWKSCVVCFLPIYIFPIALMSKRVSGIINRWRK